MGLGYFTHFSNIWNVTSLIPRSRNTETPGRVACQTIEEEEQGRGCWTPPTLSTGKIATSKSRAGLVALFVALFPRHAVLFTFIHILTRMSTHFPPAIFNLLDESIVPECPSHACVVFTAQSGKRIVLSDGKVTSFAGTEIPEGRPSTGNLKHPCVFQMVLILECDL